MKNLNSLWLGLAALAMVATGCSKDDSVAQGNEGVANLTIKIQTNDTKGIIDGLLVDGQATKFENNIAEYVAVIFDKASGNLLFREPVTGSGTAKFSNIPTGDALQILIVANGKNLANVPKFDDPDPTNNNYAALAEGTTTLQEQISGDFSTLLADMTTGFLMTGEWDGSTDGKGAGAADFILDAGDNNITVYVERVVAKIELGDISFNPDLRLDQIANFNITGFGIQNAVGTSLVNTGPIDNTKLATIPAFYGAYPGGLSIPAGDEEADPEGVLGDILGIVDLGDWDISGLLLGVLKGLTPDLTNGPLTTLLTFLNLGFVGDLVDFLTNETLAPILNVTLNSLGAVANDLLFDVGGIWYVLPSNDLVDESIPDPVVRHTTLTIEGTYEGEHYYYPIPINITADEDDGTIDNTDGTGIQRNTHYVINVLFNDLIGSPNPEIPIGLANITVTVVAKPWEQIIQNAEW